MLEAFWVMDKNLPLIFAGLPVRLRNIVGRSFYRSVEKISDHLLKFRSQLESAPNAIFHAREQSHLDPRAPLVTTDELSRLNVSGVFAAHGNSIPAAYW